ncbi:hypothetical protein ABIF74_005949 [Bradyrhizobium japonicum]
MNTVMLPAARAISRPRRAAATGLLELGHEDAAGADRIRHRIDVGGAETVGRSAHHDDGVVAACLVDIDEGRAGRRLRSPGDARPNALGFPRLDGKITEGVAADPGDEGHVCTCARSGHGLVRPLAAWSHGKSRAGDRFTDRGHVAGPEGQIDDEDAEHCDASLAHGRHSPSGAMTPLENRKQP